MTRDWIIQETDVFHRELTTSDRIPPLIMNLLATRGINGHEAIDAFLTPQMTDLYPPEQLPGARDAASLIVDAIKQNRKVVLYGDYDVDGTTGASILWHILTLAGATPKVYVPHRIEEGYGLNVQACNQLVDDGASVIVSVDCGITACDVADELKARGADLIVTDHHQAHDQLPHASAIVHPGLDGSYPNPGLCGSGVAFKLGWAIAQALSGSEKVGSEYRELLVELLPLAALGTIADIVPLVDENRIIARHGLARLTRSRIAGVRALIDQAGITSPNISAYDVGFKLAPRINAAGRMGHADLAVELLTSANAQRAREIAEFLDEHNRTRQSTERKITREAMEMIESGNLASDSRRAIVLSGEGWHPGVIGIVASRIVDRFHRPAVVIAWHDGEGQGSARSIRNFNLADALAACDENLISHGGHAMAAGLRVGPEKLSAFEEQFVAVANNRLTGRDLVPKLRLDAEVNLNVLTLPTVRLLELLGPFGSENPKPRFCTDWVDLAAEPRCVGQTQKHLQATFSQSGIKMKAIAFGQAGAIDDLKRHRKCRVAFEPIINDFNGRTNVEIQVLDFKFPE
ncbi:MAG: single-stranded-DNA-specific exonuclease RecJ [Planctomycetota bacterium]|jgi:single-stranded-DNA-specific exonuclease